MALYAKIGIITRALPTEEGIEVKMQCEDGAHILDVPANRPELIQAARDARMGGTETIIRHTEGGMVVALQPNSIGIAA